MSTSYSSKYKRALSVQYPSSMEISANDNDHDERRWRSLNMLDVRTFSSWWRRSWCHERWDWMQRKNSLPHVLVNIPFERIYSSFISFLVLPPGCRLLWLVQWTYGEEKGRKRSFAFNSSRIRKRKQTKKEYFHCHAFHHLFYECWRSSRYVQSPSSFTCS